jgi:hypothetical protein
MESVGGNYGQVLEDLGEGGVSDETTKSGASSPPTDEDDEAERGEALGFSELLAQGRSHSSSRRRSRRFSIDPDHIEVASTGSRGGRVKREANSEHLRS